jgi:hypothetical protein
MKNNIILKSKKIIVPEKLKAILWSKNIKTINPEIDKIYIIHQILSYGDIDEIKLLLKTYSLKEIKDIFLNFPKKIYTKPVFLFVKNYLLKINKELDEKYYVKSFSKCVK